MCWQKLSVSLLACIALFGCSDGAEKAKGGIEEKKVEVVEVQEQVKEEVEQKVMTQEEQEYVKVLQSSIEGFSATMDNIDTFTSSATENPALMSDNEWLGGYKFEFGKVAMYHSLFEQMDTDGVVPESFQEIHDTTTEAFGLMYIAGQSIINGIEQGNQKSIDEGGQFMSDSTEKIGEATLMLQEKVEEFQ